MTKEPDPRAYEHSLEDEIQELRAMNRRQSDQIELMKKRLIKLANQIVGG